MKRILFNMTGFIQFSWICQQYNTCTVYRHTCEKSLKKITCSRLLHLFVNEPISRFSCICACVEAESSYFLLKQFFSYWGFWVFINFHLATEIDLITRKPFLCRKKIDVRFFFFVGALSPLTSHHKAHYIYIFFLLLAKIVSQRAKRIFERGREEQYPKNRFLWSKNQVTGTDKV